MTLKKRWQFLNVPVVVHYPLALSEHAEEDTKST